jgi:hypothetical protein
VSSERPLNHSIECSSVNSRFPLDFADRQPSAVELDRRGTILISSTRLWIKRAKIRARPERSVEDVWAWALQGGGRRKTVFKPSGVESISGAITLPAASKSKSADRTAFTSRG